MAAENPHHLVLSCMDYRHMDDIAMKIPAALKSPADDYDHLVLRAMGKVKVEGKARGTRYRAA